MSFAIPINDPTAIRCHAIIDRMVNNPTGCFSHDEGWRHGSDWLTNAEGASHSHPVIAFEGDAVIRALVKDPTNETWLREGRDWLQHFEAARRAQGYYRVINLPDCSSTADLVAANMD